MAAGSPTGPQETRNFTDLAPYIPWEILDLLGEAAKTSKNKNFTEATSFLVFKTLLERKGLRPILEGLKISGQKITEVENNLKTNSDSAFLGASYRDVISKGLVVFSLNIRKALLLAFLWANRGALESRRFTPIGLSDFILALLLLPDLSLSSLKLELEKTYLGKLTYLLETNQEGLAHQPDFSGESGLTKELTKELSEKTIFNRDLETQEVLRVLVRQKRNNVLLVGEPGIGKKAVVLALIKKLQASDFGNPLKDFTFLSLDLQALGGLSARENLGKLLEIELKQKSPVVLLLENIEVFKTKEEVSLFTNFLYNLSLSVQTRFIWLSSPGFYNQFLQSESLASQNFEKITISEMGLSQMDAILTSVAGNIEKFHKVKINPKIFDDLIALCKRYMKERALPEQAISLLEESASDVAVSGRTQVEPEDVLKIISQKTGVPVTSLTISEKERLLHLEAAIGEQVIGQEEAVRKVSEAIRRSRAGLKDPKKPIGSFLFLGPTGVGKTELAKALARVVFDSEKAFVRLDMSEYSEQHTSQRLIGAPPGYVGYEEGGQLTNPILARPYSLVLLDEIEKAHPKLFDIFLQVLDDGRLTDSQGRLVDFKNTIIIATSNIAQDEILAGENQHDSLKPVILGTEGTPGSDSGQARMTNNREFFESKILPRLKEHFRLEFINRFEEIVLFNALSKEDLKKIAQIKLADVRKRLESQKITLNVTDETLVKLVDDSFDPKFGARP